MSYNEDFAREVLLEHSSHPRHKHALDDATHSVLLKHEHKADQLAVQLCIANNKIISAAFQGESSAVAIASASLMCETIRGMTVSKALELQNNIRNMLKDANSTYDPDSINPELTALCGIKQFPARVACASLAWEALESALLLKDPQRLK